jgi:hypothetical protein
VLLPKLQTRFHRVAVIFKSGNKSTEKLDFIIAGAQKAGTSALADFLETHPRVQMPHKDELHRTVQPARHFFDDEERFAEREIDYSPLERDCVRKRAANLLGSCTPIYIYWKTAMERVRDYNAAIKLIILLRDPTARAFSHWNMQRDRNLENLDFLDAVRAENERAEEARPFQLRKYSYVDRGFYAEQIERVLRFFPREQVQLIKFEEFRRDPRGVVDASCEFLGIGRLAKIDNRENNSTPYARKVTAAERQSLVDLYHDDIERLEKLLGWDCSDWKKV